MKRKSLSRKQQFAALKKESDFAPRDLIRRRLALPVERHCNFLRKRVAFRASCL